MNDSPCIRHLRDSIRGLARQESGTLREACHVLRLLDSVVAEDVADLQQLETRVTTSPHCDRWLVENRQVWWIGERFDSPVRPEEIPASPDQSTLPLPVGVLEALVVILEEIVIPEATAAGREVFCTRADGDSLVVHVDPEDVYTVQLHGTRVWTIDPPDLDLLHCREREGLLSRQHTGSFWIPVDNAHVPWVEPRTVVMRPGDFLAVPAFTQHHVVGCGTGPSISVNAFVEREDVWAERTAGRSEERRE